MLNISKKIFFTFITIFLGLGTFAIVSAQTNNENNSSVTNETTVVEEASSSEKADNIKNKSDECKGIKLNTKVPFIGNCIQFSEKSQMEAFPNLMGGLIKILVTIIILGGFVGIVAGGVMIAAAGPDDQKAKSGKKIIINIAMAMALLGASGVILRLINPNFFM